MNTKLFKQREYDDRIVYGGVITIGDLRRAFKLPKDARVTLEIIDNDNRQTYVVHVSEIDVYWQRMKRRSLLKRKGLPAYAVRKNAGQRSKP